MAVIQAIEEEHGGEAGRGRWLLLAGVGGAILWGLIFLAAT